MLGAVNNKFKAGTAAGDRYLKAVADEIMRSGDGKITLARLGGDEFGLIIDSTNPAEVKKILEKIQANLRKNLDADAHQVFREEKIVRAEDFRKKVEQALALKKEQGLPEVLTSEEKAAIRKPIDELAQIQQPDISVGSHQIGHGDDLQDIQQVAEDQAKQMKIQTALKFGRSAEKYGSDAKPESRVNPTFTAPISEPAKSTSWLESAVPSDATTVGKATRPITLIQKEEVKAFATMTLIRSEDEMGRSVYQVEQFVTDAAGKSVKITKDVPTNSATGLLDARHPDIQKIVLEHIRSSPDSIVIMPKLTILKYLNYFEDGTSAGDKVLAEVASIIKKDMRSSDLSFKLGGADFLWSIDQGAARNVLKIEEKINDDLAKSPVIKEIIKKERETIKKLLSEAQKNISDFASQAARAKEIQKLTVKLSELDKFKPDLSFQSATHHEVQNLNFDQITSLFENKFKSAATGSK
jgi:GGDEF domain-containing protein